LLYGQGHLGSAPVGAAKIGGMHWHVMTSIGTMWHFEGCNNISMIWAEIRAIGLPRRGLTMAQWRRPASSGAGRSALCGAIQSSYERERAMDTAATNANTPVNRVSEARAYHGKPEAGAPARSGDRDNGERQAHAHPGRDAKGRFAKGNLGGPGNPHARRVAQYRRALWNAVTDGDIDAIVRRQVEKAKEGDRAAAKLVLAYTAGKPVPTVDADTLDLQEWEILKQTPVPMDEFEQPLTGMPKDLACDVNRIAIPCLRQQYGEVVKLGVFSDDATYAAMCAVANTAAAAETTDGEPADAMPASHRAPTDRAARRKPATPRPASRKRTPPSAIGETALRVRRHRHPTGLTAPAIRPGHRHPTGKTAARNQRRHRQPTGLTARTGRRAASGPDKVRSGDQTAGCIHSMPAFRRAAGVNIP
jgi:hypothetical protein